MDILDKKNVQKIQNVQNHFGAAGAIENRHGRLGGVAGAFQTVGGAAGASQTATGGHSSWRLISEHGVIKATHKQNECLRL